MFNRHGLSPPPTRTLSALHIFHRRGVSIWRRCRQHSTWGIPTPLPVFKFSSTPNACRAAYYYCRRAHYCTSSTRARRRRHPRQHRTCCYTLSAVRQQHDIASGRAVVGVNAVACLGHAPVHAFGGHLRKVCLRHQLEVGRSMSFRQQLEHHRTLVIRVPRVPAPAILVVVLCSPVFVTCLFRLSDPPAGGPSRSSRSAHVRGV